MADVCIDHAKQALVADPGTWGDLLAILDQQVAVRQLLVTAIRLDGVEEPAFRQPSATDRPQAAVGRVDVETTPPAAFVRQCCADTEDAVGEIATRVPELTSHRMVQIGGWLGSLVAAQTREDCITVSDILEHDPEPAQRRRERTLCEVAARAVVLRIPIRP